MRPKARAASAIALAPALAGPLAPGTAQAMTAAHARTAHGSQPQFLSTQRLLTIPGTVNARDTGGYRTYDGKTTRWGVLYRSESLAKIPPEGVTALADLRLGSVIDLRTAIEVQADGTDRLPEGVASVPQPVDDTSLFAFIGQVVRSKDPVYQQAMLGGGKAEDIPEAIRRSRARSIMIRSSRTWVSPAREKQRLSTG
ncbi:tyrosine-protein phosphatase [Streptomyces sp. NPDC001410]|uniref:tyrosine-protein phosphatase n=1 Tax=Streptomyces sp. NPDC001410 TaxID=3364574 RepID=UPI0036856C63